MGSKEAKMILGSLRNYDHYGYFLLPISKFFHFSSQFFWISTKLEQLILCFEMNQILDPSDVWANSGPLNLTYWLTKWKTQLPSKSNMWTHIPNSYHWSEPPPVKGSSCMCSKRPIKIMKLKIFKKKLNYFLLIVYIQSSTTNIKEMLCESHRQSNSKEKFFKVT